MRPSSPRRLAAVATVLLTSFALCGTAHAVPASTQSAPPPTVTSVSPERGSAAGFQPVLIRGTQLAATTAVLFGKRPAESFQVQSSRAVLAVAPVGHAGRSVHVQVQTDAGTSAKSRADGFTFLSPAPVHVANAPVGGSPYGWVDSIDCPAYGWCASSDEVRPLALSVVTGGSAQSFQIPLPADGNADRSDVSTISCSAVGSCVAIGTRDYTVGAMIATLKDGSVTSVPIDGLAGEPRSVLWDASCNTTVCVAVGGGYNDDTGKNFGGIVQRTRTGTWARVPLPSLPVLFTVSCGGSSCVALGATYAPVVLVRTASGWQRSQLPAPAGGSGVELTDADCYQQDACVASGSFTAADGLQHQLFERWDGSSWTAFSVRRPATLTGGFSPGPLSCTASGVCYAAGDANTYFKATAFVARLDADGTSVAALPVRTNRGPVVLTGSVALACSSSAFCVLGSSYQTHDPEFGTVFYDTYVLSNGVWTNEDSPRYFAASCASRDFCGLGGANADGGVVRTMSEKY